MPKSEVPKDRREISTELPVIPEMSYARMLQHLLARLSFEMNGIGADSSNVADDKGALKDPHGESSVPRKTDLFRIDIRAGKQVVQGCLRVLFQASLVGCSTADELVVEPIPSIADTGCKTFRPHLKKYVSRRASASRCFIPKLAGEPIDVSGGLD